MSPIRFDHMISNLFDHDALRMARVTFLFFIVCAALVHIFIINLLLFQLRFYVFCFFVVTIILFMLIIVVSDDVFHIDVLSFVG